MNRKIAFVFIVSLIVAIFSGCASEPYREGLQQQELTQEEKYAKIAEFYVSNMHIFTEYEGYNLELVETQSFSSDDSYKFYFQFDSDSPFIKEKGVVGYQVNVYMKSGKIEDVHTLEIIYDIVEILNISCETQADCRVPYNYVMQSNCPYISLCQESRCTVICPSFNGIVSHDSYDESQLKAIEIAKSYLTTIESFHKYRGRNIKIMHIISARCVGCFNVELQYELDSSKNLSVTDIATANIVLSNWKVIDSSLSQGSKEKISLDKALFIAQNSECVNAGELTAESYYNNVTKTWWIELDAQKGICNPVCVVNEETRIAEVNYRCVK